MDKERQENAKMLKEDIKKMMDDLSAIYEECVKMLYKGNSTSGQRFRVKSIQLEKDFKVLRKKTVKGVREIRKLMDVEAVDSKKKGDK